MALLAGPLTAHAQHTLNIVNGHYTNIAQSRLGATTATVANLAPGIVMSNLQYSTGTALRNTFTQQDLVVIYAVTNGAAYPLLRDIDRYNGIRMMEAVIAYGKTGKLISSGGQLHYVLPPQRDGSQVTQAQADTVNQLYAEILTHGGGSYTVRHKVTIIQVVIYLSTTNVAEAGFVPGATAALTGFEIGQKIGMAADQMLQEFASTETNAAIDYSMFQGAINELNNMAVANIATNAALAAAELALAQALSIPLTPPEFVDVNYDGEAGAYDLMEAAGIAQNWCSDPYFNCASTN